MAPPTTDPSLSPEHKKNIIGELADMFVDHPGASIYHAHEGMRILVPYSSEQLQDIASHCTKKVIHAFDNEDVQDLVIKLLYNIIDRRNMNNMTDDQYSEYISRSYICERHPDIGDEVYVPDTSVPWSKCDSDDDNTSSSDSDRDYNDSLLNANRRKFI